MVRGHKFVRVWKKLQQQSQFEFGILFEFLVYFQFLISSKDIVLEHCKLAPKISQVELIS